MVIENFKSYGGVKEIGPFHKSFSSVVGPNGEWGDCAHARPRLRTPAALTASPPLVPVAAPGSGKSNVIDAMLFVFGKKASQMRFNKLSELIHRSAEYPDLEYARVSVFFQEIVDDTASEDDFAIVPGSQVVVTRTATRSNASTYYLNDKKRCARHGGGVLLSPRTALPSGVEARLPPPCRCPCRSRCSTMTEVTTLLKARGIDLDHNRFLILQGEVEQIAMMKPKGLTPGDEGERAQHQQRRLRRCCLRASPAAYPHPPPPTRCALGAGLLEYLEDIIGSNAYVQPIAEAEKVRSAGGCRCCPRDSGDPGGVPELPMPNHTFAMPHTHARCPLAGGGRPQRPAQREAQPRQGGGKGARVAGDGEARGGGAAE